MQKRNSIVLTTLFPKTCERKQFFQHIFEKRAGNFFFKTFIPLSLYIFSVSIYVFFCLFFFLFFISFFKEERSSYGTKAIVASKTR